MYVCACVYVCVCAYTCRLVCSQPESVAKVGPLLSGDSSSSVESAKSSTSFFFHAEVGLNPRYRHESRGMLLIAVG